ncbi:unnamed protein product [Linum tenue]|uniref:Germin-like protein n=1 Tax=Linum tenue TaxID=586396 RepID=A0AAV0QGC7_9ROSI|nr:unnamed protein product [Linum tenue]
MASLLKLFFSILATTLLATSQLANSGDPDILSDFILPPDLPEPDEHFFTFNGTRGIFDATRPTSFKIAKASLAEFPSLEAELLLVARGVLEVGLVDSANRLYTQTLQSGDMFVFPKGLVHYQSNVGRNTAVAFSAFGSASAGTVSLPTALFGSGIDDDVLAKGFKTDEDTVRGLEAGLAPPMKY